MRRTLHLLALLLTFSITQAAAQTFQWAKVIKSEGFDESYDVATDQQGNVYVTGMTEFEADCGNNVILESHGKHDIFVAKYDSSGNLIWARNAGGKGGDKAQAIVLDGQGYFYITGEFEDTSYWENIMLTTPGLGINNVFVARYDTSGHVIWVRNLRCTAPFHTRGYGVACDAASNVYVSGGTNGETYYDSTYLFTTAGDYDVLFAKFDKDGNFIWAQKMGGVDSDKGRGVVSDGGSNIYLTGYFVGHADFDGTQLNGAGHTDVFLAKFDTSGTMQWVKQAGDTGFDRGWNVDVNVNGQILVVGDESRGYFDSHVASCSGMTDAFVAAYDNSGNNLWVTAGGGVEDDECKSVAHDSAGNIYVAGDYGGSATFPPVTFTGHHFAEPYVASYTSDGSTLRWIRSGSGPSNDRGTGVSIDPQGNIILSGNFEDSLQLGSLTIHGDSLLDIYTTKLSPQNTCSSMASVSGTITCYGTCDGIATAIAFGQAPFTYVWSTLPVQNQQTATGLCAGTYTVTVTDSMGCTSNASITLVDPPQLTVTSSSTNITCNGACDGTADALPAGQSPFSYSWNTQPVQTTQSATGLCAGTYTVTVTDAAGCTATSDQTLVDPALLTVTGTTTNPSCFGCADGSIDITPSGGSGSFQYLWSSGETTEDLQNIASGTYSVCITDANLCMVCDTFVVNDNTTGIDEPGSVNTLVLFPNPATNQVTVSVNKSFGVHKEIKLFDSLGKLVYADFFFATQLRIPLDGLSNGIYLLQVRNEDTGNELSRPLIVSAGKF